MAKSKQLESTVQRRIAVRLRDAGYMVVKIGLCSMPGFPDLMALKDGKAAFVEVKRPGLKPRPLQEHRIAELKRMGFVVVVADTENEITALIERT